jgi:signal transduction histidine kinase
LALAVVLVLALVASWLSLRQKLDDDLALAHQSSERELRLIASYISNALQESQYQDVERFLREWGEKDASITQLKLTAANGFALATYQRPGKVEHGFALVLPISYSYRGEASIRLGVDLGQVYQRQYRLMAQLAAIFSVLAVLLTALVHIALQRQRKAVQLAQSEQALQQLAHGLEQRVAERTTELAVKNSELEAFTYSVSHDLKAPLRGIDGYSRMLSTDYGERLDEEGRFFVQTIRNATEQMGQLIDDLLAYSRIERRGMAVTQIAPRLLVESLVAERAAEIRERQVKMTVNIECQSVQAEAEGLALALRNLLDNALKFTRQVAEPSVEIGGKVQDGKCVMWVRDNGPGFDMQYHERIFEIFQRLNRAEDYPGTGIGLAIVRKSMQRMHGRAWAQSEPGKGATIFLEMPTTEEPA